MKIIKTIGLLMGMAALATACYPGGPSYTEDYDVVFATPATDYDFTNKAQNTYVMPDTIVDLTDPDEVKDPPKIPESTQNVIISQVETNLANFGYTQLADSEVHNADYIFLCQRIVSNNYVTYYWGGYYPGWGWGGYYPPSYSTYNYQTGTLYVTMIDVATSDTVTDKINFIWDAGVNGLLGTTTFATQERITLGIDRMFLISTYLKKN